MKKKWFRRIAAGAIGTLAVALLATWALWMRTPAGAVRNEILINGHPIKALTAKPRYDAAASRTLHKQIWAVTEATGYVVSDGSYRVTRFKITGGSGLYAAREQADVIQ